MELGWNMHRISIEFLHHRYALGGLALVALFFATPPAHADQQLESNNPYSAVDPFDPSETITNTLKDDIRLRLRLPAPDLPLSVVEAKQPSPMPQEAITSSGSVTQSTSEAMSEPGILSKSISTVMSIFDWSGDSEVAAKSPTPEQASEQSNEPIRINVHVGIKKPQRQPTAEVSGNEISSLQSPWSRNQKRVRQFFTIGEIKTHE
jgi:hypothetical protein